MAERGWEGDSRLKNNHMTGRTDVLKICVLRNRDITSWMRCSPFGMTQDQDRISWEQHIMNQDIMVWLRL